MQPYLSPKVVEDVQRRARADAAAYRRTLEAPADDAATDGQRWIVRIWSGLPLRRRSADRIGA